MSDVTYKALEEALSAHLADEHDGAMVTGWVATVAGVSGADLEAGTRYMHLCSDGPWHVALGLIEMQRQSWAQRYVEGEF